MRAWDNLTGVFYTHQQLEPGRGQLQGSKGSSHGVGVGQTGEKSVHTGESMRDKETETGTDGNTEGWKEGGKGR